MQTLLNLAQEYWLLIVLAIVAILVIRFVVGLAVKIVTVAIIIGLVLIFVFHMSPGHVFGTEKNVMSGTAQTLQETVVPILESELKNAHYSVQSDGKTYDITTEHVKIEGKKGDPTATVYYNGHSFPIDLRVLGKAVQNDINQHINGVAGN